MKEAPRGFYIYHFWKLWFFTNSSNSCWAAFCGIYPWLFFIVSFWLCSATLSCKKKFWVAHPSSRFHDFFLIHNLHIYLRVDIRKADIGQFVDFVLTSVAAQKCLPASPHLPIIGVPGCLVLTAGQCPTTLETQGRLRTGPSSRLFITSYSPAMCLSKHWALWSSFQWNAPLNTFDPFSVSGLTVGDRKLLPSENKQTVTVYPSIHTAPVTYRPPQARVSHNFYSHCTKSTWIIQHKRPLNTVLYIVHFYCTCFCCQIIINLSGERCIVWFMLFSIVFRSFRQLFRIYHSIIKVDCFCRAVLRHHILLKK